jgi:FAD:protein FMN transferase
MGAHPERVRLAMNAMATRFEIVILDRNPVRARAAGEQALEEIRIVERQLSFFRPSSALSTVNRGADEAPVRTSALLYEILEQASELTRQTDGAFDPTVGPLLARFRGTVDHLPSRPGVLKAAGMGEVILDRTARSVAFGRPGTLLDLGGIAKGYAIDRAMEVLKESGIRSALIHGGTSTAAATGSDDGRPWTIAIAHPHPERSREVIALVELSEESLSVSSIYGRGKGEIGDGDGGNDDDGGWAGHGGGGHGHGGGGHGHGGGGHGRGSDGHGNGGDWAGHVIDPRDGTSVSHTEMAAVVAPAATSADALSTALLVLGRAELGVFEYCLTLTSSPKGIQTRGAWKLANLPSQPSPA